MTPTLETTRLILKPASLDDCAELQPLFNNWDVVQYLANVPWPYPTDGMTAFTRGKVLPDMAVGKLHVWTIINRETNQPIGRIDLRPNLLERSTEHWGYWLAIPYQQNGFMGEAANAVADFGFNTLKMPEITARVAKENTGSTKLQQSLGAQNSHEGMGQYCCGEREQIVWRLTPDAWRASVLYKKYHH